MDKDSTNPKKVGSLRLQDIKIESNITSGDNANPLLVGNMTDPFTTRTVNTGTGNTGTGITGDTPTYVYGSCPSTITLCGSDTCYVATFCADTIGGATFCAPGDVSCGINGGCPSIWYGQAYIFVDGERDYFC